MCACEATTSARRELDPKANKGMYTWVYKHKTPARRELDPKNKYRNAHVGVQMQNTCKKGVRPKKQTNGCIRGYTIA